MVGLGFYRAELEKVDPDSGTRMLLKKLHANSLSRRRAANPKPPS